MYASDFTHAKSTHELLFLLFCSEIGLLSVSHPTVQLLAVTQSFSSLQSIIVQNLREGKKAFSLQMTAGDTDTAQELPEVVVSYTAEAKLFMNLYTGLSSLDPNRALANRVYPLVGEMVLQNSALKRTVEIMLDSHAKRWGPAVRERMCNSLLKFDLSELAPGLRQ